MLLALYFREGQTDTDGPQLFAEVIFHHVFFLTDFLREVFPPGACFAQFNGNILTQRRAVQPELGELGNKFREGHHDIGLCFSVKMRPRPDITRSVKEFIADAQLRTHGNRGVKLNIFTLFQQNIGTGETHFFQFFNRLNALAAQRQICIHFLRGHEKALIRCKVKGEFIPLSGNCSALSENMPVRHLFQRGRADGDRLFFRQQIDHKQRGNAAVFPEDGIVFIVLARRFKRQFLRRAEKGLQRPHGIAATPLDGLAFWRRLTPRYLFNIGLEKRLFRPGSKTRIFHISQHQKAEYQEAYGTPDSRFYELPPDIPSGCGRPADALERRERMREELELEEDELLFLNIGNFQISGADRAIVAIASLPHELRSRCQLLLAGSGNVSAIRRLAKRCGLEDQVRFTLIDNELNDLILASDLLLHPARGEEAGTAPLEALYAGVPVVASSSGGWAKEIVASNSILLPAPFRQIDLNHTLRLLLSTPAKLEEMTREAVAIGSNLDLKRRFEFAADIILEGK